MNEFPPKFSLPEVLSRDEIRAALSSVCASSNFRYAPAQQTFLNFVTESTIAGNSRLLKAYTIAVDGFGRRSDFDPDTDAIVRVTAIRVRRSLKAYYALEGTDDSIIVDIPNGQYIPVFSRKPKTAVSLADIAARRKLSVAPLGLSKWMGKWVVKLWKRPQPTRLDC
jgi:hypothetical protein